MKKNDVNRIEKVRIIVEHSIIVDKPDHVTTNEELDEFIGEVLNDPKLIIDSEDESTIDIRYINSEEKMDGLKVMMSGNINDIKNITIEGHFIISVTKPNYIKSKETLDRYIEDIMNRQYKNGMYIVDSIECDVKED